MDSDVGTHVPQGATACQQPQETGCISPETAKQGRSAEAPTAHGPWARLPWAPLRSPLNEGLADGSDRPQRTVEQRAAWPCSLVLPPPWTRRRLVSVRADSDTNAGHQPGSRTQRHIQRGSRQHSRGAGAADGGTGARSGSEARQEQGGPGAPAVQRAGQLSVASSWSWGGKELQRAQPSPWEPTPPCTADHHWSHCL